MATCSCLPSPACLVRIHPGLEILRSQSRKWSSRLVRSPFGSMMMAGMPFKRGFLEHGNAQTGLARAGHAGDDRMCGQVGRIVGHLFIGKQSVWRDRRRVPGKSLNRSYQSPAKWVEHIRQYCTRFYTIPQVTRFKKFAEAFSPPQCSVVAIVGVVVIRHRLSSSLSLKLSPPLLSLALSLPGAALRNSIFVTMNMLFAS
jgi:hypothetical protein